MFDLLIRNGRVIDPAQNLDAPRDVAVRGGRIAAILEPGSPVETLHTLDASRRLVVPGLIDLHVHVFPGISHFGVDPDPTCLARGVTTVVDFGTAGSLTFDGFRRYIIDKVQTRVFALLHIAGQGLISSLPMPDGLGELHDLRYCSVEQVERMVDRHRDVICGIKIRLTDNLAEEGRNEAEALRLAREAADRASLPLVIHTPKSSLSIGHILSQMRAGDVLTHCYHGHRCGLVDEQLQVLPAVREALDRGILLDVGHGMAAFDFRVARSLLHQGIVADFISSDLHHYNVEGPVRDQVTTLDKFLHLGMSLPEVIRRTTETPARFLGRPEQLGTLKPGAAADITILELREGEFPLTDSMGQPETGRWRLEPTHVFREGRQFGILPGPAAPA